MNPQVATLIEMMRAAMPPGTPRLWDLPAAEGRPRSDAFLRALNAGGPDMAEQRDFTVPGPRGPIPVRLYVPRAANDRAASPGLLYLHGGGFVIGNPDTHDRLTRELAEGIGARVLSVDYRLAPEYPYPAGLEDCAAAATWLVREAASIGVDPTRLLIGGDSAGGNLSAGTIFKLREAGLGIPFRGALLIYGYFTHEPTPSKSAWGDRDLVLSRRVIDWFKAQYVGEREDADDPYLNPLRGDLRGFPPSILVAGTLDPLLDDSKLFAAALEKAGVPVELHVYEDGLHAFAQFSLLDMCGDALARLSAFGRARV
ncbi:MAG TPA: alpha/beta hydrolase [Terriglobales bacterium]|nr:alpha/beta hydrolase [Terriglobales bacterium]